MDDLSGLDWSASSSTSATKASVTGTGNYYPSLRPNPSPAISGRSTPVSAQASGIQKAAAQIPKSSTPDSFSNLVSFGSAKQTTLTLQQQQEKLQAERARREEEKRKQYNAQFGDSSFWDGLGDKQRTAASVTPQTSIPASNTIASNLNPFAHIINNDAKTLADEDDLFAAFNKDAVVDKSSHYPPPSLPDSHSNTPEPGKALDLSNPQAWQSATSNPPGAFDNDDDPFGLSQMRQVEKGPIINSHTAGDDDDFLGDLGKPVEEVQRPPIVDPEVPQSAQETEFGRQRGSTETEDPWDKAVNELVDMGFSTENSRRALTESGAGLNIQAAVSWLLNDAHRQAKQKLHAGAGSSRVDAHYESRSNGSSRETSERRSRNDATPAWMRQNSRERSQPRRNDGGSSADGDHDIAKTAAAISNNLLKTANTFWKTSQKRVQQAVAEFQQDADPNQPKWMRPDTIERDIRSEKHVSLGEQRRQLRQETASPSVTDEAMMLESGSRPPKKVKSVAEVRQHPSTNIAPREQSPSISVPSTGRSTPVPRWQQSSPAPPLDVKSRLSKQAIEDQSAQAYVSPARRKKTTPTTQPVQDSNHPARDTSLKPNVLPSAATPEPFKPSKAPSKALRPAQVSTPIPVRLKTPARLIPPLSPAALATSTQHRLAGTAHYKRGDYAAAHSSYSNSLSVLPQDHPITIVLLCNRSLTALKIGEPKSAVTDADAALNLIGESRGENEVIDLQGDGVGEGKKDMKEFWGKALSRKAEALEQMERWSDAAAVWKQAVESGVGGIVAAQGRQRCDRALQPKPKPAARPPTKVTPKPRPSTASNFASTQNFEAVNRLRAANAAAEKADDEKFALADSVDARLVKWREGRKDNLRALLGGLDQVLWEDSGWNKIGMHELVMNGKVKINYMKAIAKVHPDKLPQNATTEQQMISAAVFSTLNEAWDKFKAENGM